MRYRTADVIKSIAGVIAILVAFQLGSVYLLFLESGSLVHRRVATAAPPGPTIKLHPYYGFVPGYGDEYRRAAGLTVNNYGFAQVGNTFPGCCDFPIPAREREHLFLVGVFGNSIGRGIGEYLQLHQEILKPLEQLPGAANKKIVLLNLAVGGHMQPQEAMILQHLLAIGLKLDLVVLFSASQEVVSKLGNGRAGVLLDFPTTSGWLLIAQALEPFSSDHPLDLVGPAFGAAARDFERSMERCRLASCVVRVRAVIHMAHYFADRFTKAATDSGNDPPHFFAGWQRNKVDEESQIQQSLMIWHRSVLLMSHSTRAFGGEFMTFLLPSPWDHGSKVEPKVLYSPGRPTDVDLIKRIMPVMGDTTQNQRRAGVHAVDATRVLDPLPLNSDLFIDEIGHLGPAGLRRVSEFMVEQTVQTLK